MALKLLFTSLFLRVTIGVLAPATTKRLPGRLMITFPSRSSLTPSPLDPTRTPPELNSAKSGATFVESGAAETPSTPTPK